MGGVLFTLEEIARIKREQEPIGAVLQDLIVEINYERIQKGLNPIPYSRKPKRESQ